MPGSHRPAKRRRTTTNVIGPSGNEALKSTKAEEIEAKQSVVNEVKPERGSKFIQKFPGYGWYEGTIVAFDKRSNKWEVYFCADGTTFLYAQKKMIRVLQASRKRMEAEDQCRSESRLSKRKPLRSQPSKIVPKSERKKVSKPGLHNSGYKKKPRQQKKTSGKKNSNLPECIIIDTETESESGMSVPGSPTRSVSETTIEKRELGMSSRLRKGSKKGKNKKKDSALMLSGPTAQSSKDKRSLGPRPEPNAEPSSERIQTSASSIDTRKINLEQGCKKASFTTAAHPGDEPSRKRLQQPTSIVDVSNRQNGHTQ
eukprot:CAMPEP_0114492486 /NCGR_PEP_ID=MMETSP0109-20121206/3578_1 /TAXON_ID=29199 /ORGANISM="Chlorarachnion reptans, Strain CCCM449" /LENGTH=312 /DNA_ID=CAMNT_0001669327 /DNA_START=1610 /DNA_END=2548 /DNA_ORIENTATION=+